MKKRQTKWDQVKHLIPELADTSIRLTPRGRYGWHRSAEEWVEDRVPGISAMLRNQIISAARRRRVFK